MNYFECDGCGEKISSKNSYGGWFQGNGPWCFYCWPERQLKGERFAFLAKKILDQNYDVIWFFIFMSFCYGIKFDRLKWIMERK